METHQSVCDWDGDQLVVYISTQYVWGIRDEVSRRLGLPPDKVRVVCDYMGGGFGVEERRRATTRTSPPSSRSAPAVPSSAR